MAESAMTELRQWRDLSRRRDLNIRRAAREEGKSVEQIAHASGLGTRRIQKILNRIEDAPL